MNGGVILKRQHHYIKLLIVFWIVYFLIKDFEVIRAEIVSVLKLWSGTLIPSLFPYLVLSGWLTSSGALTKVSHILFPFKKILSLSDDGTGVWLCSLFCGYPSGAVCTSELYTNGKISKREAERLLCFTNNAGPLFLISAVGECMLGSSGDGVMIYVIQTISALLCAAVLSAFGGRGENGCEYKKHEVKDCGSSFCRCCQTSVNAMLMICAYAVCASVASRVILISSNGIIVRLPHGIRGWIEGAVYGIFEISTALSKISSLKSSAMTLPVICALVSWSGVSVILQIKSVIPCELSIRKLVCSKIFQSVLSFCLALIYQNTQNIPCPDFPTDLLIKTSVVMSIIVFVLLVFGKQRNRIKTVN